MHATRVLACLAAVGIAGISAGEEKVDATLGVFDEPADISKYPELVRIEEGRARVIAEADEKRLKAYKTLYEKLNKASPGAEKTVAVRQRIAMYEQKMEEHKFDAAKVKVVCAIYGKQMRNGNTFRDVTKQARQKIGLARAQFEVDSREWIKSTTNVPGENVLLVYYSVNGTPRFVVAPDGSTVSIP